MKIVLGGKAGSGKSVVAKRLKEIFNLKHYSTGDLMRKIAGEKGYKIEDYMKVVEAEIDKEVDSRTEKIGKEEDNFIFDSRLAFHFIPDAIKIFLEVSDEEGARRIFANQRESEAKAETVEELANRNRDRWETDRQRYIKLYNVDVNNREEYDVLIDTTELSLDEVVDGIRRAVETLCQK